LFQLHQASSTLSPLVQTSQIRSTAPTGPGLHGIPTLTVHSPPSPASSRRQPQSFPPHTKEKSASAAAWVGIDGSTCQTAIFQTGIDFTISNKGHITYDAWYEWFPAYAEDFTDFKIHPGDVIVASVKTTSTTSGTATIENKTTGHSVSKTLTSVVPLCQENAEWIVEDYEEGWTQVPFADFGTVDFKHAVATTKWGATIGPKGATIVDLTASNIVLTSVSTKSNEVIVKYKT